MNKALDLAGSLAGGLGLLLCLVAGVGRLAGQYHLVGFEAMTLFSAGIALLVAGTFLKVSAGNAR
jgi:hypothetical protein